MCAGKCKSGQLPRRGCHTGPPAPSRPCILSLATVCKDTIILRIIFISMLIMIIVIAIIAQVFRYKDYISTKMYKALLVCTTATIL